MIFADMNTTRNTNVSVQYAERVIRMSKERLEEIEERFYKTGYEINTASPEPQQIHADLQYLISTVKEQAERVESMAHVIKVKNKEMRELSIFLKERNIPLKELSPLITVMNHVQELERQNKQFKSNLSVVQGYYKNMVKINEDIVAENKKYRGLIKDMGKEIEILTDVMSDADNADELNEEIIRLKGKLEESE